MSSIFRIDVLPAQRGDALWIEYGPAAAPHRILVDGGITRTGREILLERAAALGPGAHIDLLIVTHIDLDHIQGAIEFINKLPENVVIDSIWFNGLDQLPPDPLEKQGPVQGFELMRVLDDNYAAHWNAESGGGAMCVEADGSPHVLTGPGNMTITVLSPDHDKLLALRREWDQVAEAFGAQEEAPEEDALAGVAGLEVMGAEEIDVSALASARFKEDNKAPNGSSIAVMLEFEGRRALLLGDAHPSLVLKGLKQMSPRGALEVDCVKASHHGSRKNTNRELIEQLRARYWVFSSNGKQTRHPDREAVARVLAYSPGPKALIFNYRTEYNECWDDEYLKSEHDFTTVFGDERHGVTLDLMGVG